MKTESKIETKFNSRVDKVLIALLLVVAISPLVLTAIAFAKTGFFTFEFLIIFCLTCIPLLLIMSMLFNTYYITKGGELHYRQSFISGKINIGKIRKIKRGQTLWAGLKPALARKGLIIYYNSYDEIYISPEREDEFLKELMRWNSEIEIC